MALSASTVFQIQSTATASNVNSGGFNPANTNMLTDGAATSANGNSPVFSSASYNFVAGDVGHWVYIKSGTSWTPGWYQVASVAANAATLSAAIGQGIQVNNNLYGTNTVAGAATVASPTGATWTMDYSQTDASPFTATDLTGATTTCTSASAPFGLQMAGNLIHLNTTGTGGTVGWYEIVSISVVTATLDRSAGTTFSGVTFHTGGALSLGSSDDAVFELAVSSSTAATRYFIKGGSNITYTLGGTVSVSAAGNAAWPVIYESFVSTRGDRPTGATRPTFACAAATFTMGSTTFIWGLKFTGTAASVVTTGTSGRLYNCKSINTSVSAGRNAFTPTGANSSLFYCEGISYNGEAFETATNTKYIIDTCYAHDSTNGILLVAPSVSVVKNCIFSSCITAAINVSASSTDLVFLEGNTLYGAENKLGIGISIGASSTLIIAKNNIIYGFATGISHADTQTTGYDDYNNYFNNTADVSAVGQWQKGPHDIAVNPSFTNAVQRTGTTATTTAGQHLVQSGATFVTWGITAGTDYVYIKSGTGVTTGIYGITSVDSETQITLDLNPTANATADKIWQISQGGNFLPTGAV